MTSKNILINCDMHEHDFHSHLILILASLAVGTSQLQGLVQTNSTLACAHIMKQLGANIEFDAAKNVWLVQGTGLGTLQEPVQPIMLGNIIEHASLLLGLLAGHHLTATLIGNTDQEEIAFTQVMHPLEQMGARFTARQNDKLPMTLLGARNVLVNEIALGESNQTLKWALLLCGLNARGETTVIEPKAMSSPAVEVAKAFGIDIREEMDEDEIERQHTVIVGQPFMKAINIIIE